MGKPYKRHIAKTITWRLVGTADTILLSWFVSGSSLIGIKIGLAEVVTKMILYYLHERFWFKKRSGGDKEGSKRRHLWKTVTWRIVGTLDTVTLAWFISGDPMVGFQVGAAEVVTKMLLYYLHERLWYRSDYGLTKRRTRVAKKD